VIHLNNRKVLSGIAEVCGETDKILDITVAIDKLDKIGEDGVVEELRTKGVSEEAIQKIRPLFHLQGENQDLLNNLSTYLSDSLIGQQGVAELQYVLDTVAELGLERGILKLDVTLARGLNYYTGAIFAAVTNASTLEIWTDVTGMMTADPRLVQNPKPIEAISYQEAMELSHFGAKIIYPPTIQPVMPGLLP
jgi:histidyl-tRNA synthetase